MLHGANPRMCSAKCEPIWSLFSVCVVWDTSTPLKALVGTLTPWERGYVMPRRPKLGLVRIDSHCHTLIIGTQNIVVRRYSSMTGVSFICLNLT